MESFIQNVDNAIDINSLVNEKESDFECHFHEDDNKSATIRDNQYECKCCGVTMTATEYHSQRYATPLAFSAFLLSRGKVPPPKAVDPDVLKRIELLKVIKSVAFRCKKALFAKNKYSETCLDYLKNERNLDKDTIDNFHIGFFPGGKWFIDELVKDSDIDLLLELGIVKKSEKNDSLYSPFSNRVLFPIVNELNQICAFGGRVLPGDNRVKYYNSPTSSIFQKSEITYRCPSPFSQKKVGVIVEGYLDVISCSNVSTELHLEAPLGTAMNATQIRRLHQKCGSVILVTDGDNAGIKASLRAIKDLLPKLGKIDIRLTTIPDNLDPDEYISSHGPDGFLKLLNNAKTPSEFVNEHENINPQTNKLLHLEMQDNYNLAPIYD